MSARFEAEKFTGKNDFKLWRMKMRAMLIQQGLADALVVSDPKSKAKEDEGDAKTQAKRAEIQQEAHSAVILCLGDKVLREVAKETSAAGILSKLESLYMTKSLANRLYMKQRLYSYRFSDERMVSEQIEDFNKAIDDLENIDVSIADKDKAILMLNALPKSHDQLRDAMIYGRERTITLLEVQSAIQAKELQKGDIKSQDQNAESLNIKRFKGKKMQKKKHFETKSDGADQKETRSCHWCKKPGHLKKDCFAWKMKQTMNPQTQHTASCVEDNEAPEILNVMERVERSSWIMDSGYSFHMCPRRDWFEQMVQCEGSVVLGNN